MVDVTKPNLKMWLQPGKKKRVTKPNQKTVGKAHITGSPGCAADLGIGMPLTGFPRELGNLL
jgi:hypothetical protein